MTFVRPFQDIKARALNWQLLLTVAPSWLIIAIHAPYSADSMMVNLASLPFPWRHTA
jgi:hypothetical protein